MEGSDAGSDEVPTALPLFDKEKEKDRKERGLQKILPFKRSKRKEEKEKDKEKEKEKDKEEKKGKDKERGKDRDREKEREREKDREHNDKGSDRSGSALADYSRRGGANDNGSEL